LVTTNLLKDKVQRLGLGVENPSPGGLSDGFHRGFVGVAKQNSKGFDALNVVGQGSIVYLLPTSPQRERDEVNYKDTVILNMGE
jgi:hypothetical protein